MGGAMKLERARIRILALWLLEEKTWEQDNYTTFFQSSRSFYDKLERHNADVLGFRNLGDRWQVVNRWIHEHEGYFSS